MTKIFPMLRFNVDCAASEGLYGAAEGRVLNKIFRIGKFLPDLKIFYREGGG